MSKFILSNDDFIKPTAVNFQDNIDIIEGGNMLEVIEEKGDDQKNYVDKPIIIENINNIISKKKSKVKKPKEQIDEDFEIEYSESSEDEDNEFRIEYDDEDLSRVEKSTYVPTDNKESLLTVGGEYSEPSEPETDNIVEQHVESIVDEDTVILESYVDDNIVGGDQEESIESIIGNYISEFDLQEI